MPTDTRLIRAYAAQQDADAFAELVRRHADMVYGACFRILRSRHDAEDAAQECFFLLAQHAIEVSESVAGWLHTTATRRALNMARSESTRSRHEAQTRHEAINTGDLTWQEIVPHVDAALEQLSEEQRVALVWHYLEERTQAEIAQELGVDASTVNRRIKSGLRELRRRLTAVGVTGTAVTIAALLGDHAAVAAPASLRVSLGKMAMTGVRAKGAAATAAVHGKFAAGVAASILAVCATAAYTQSLKPRNGVAQTTKAQPARRAPNAKPRRIPDTATFQLNPAFMAPDRDVDQHGNPVVKRKGSAADPRARWPYEIWLKSPRVEFVLVPAGAFVMGDSTGDPSAKARDKPAHRVRITKPFYLGKYEITNAQFRAFRPAHDSGSATGRPLNGDSQPALHVSWIEADAYCRWLTDRSKASVRLPTEAEWEYACRGGGSDAYYWGTQLDEKHGNLADAATPFKWRDSGLRDGYAASAPAGRFLPNRLGLYDMAGNAWEWCADWFDGSYYGRSPGQDPRGPDSGTYRVLRGGSWDENPLFLRSSRRSRERPKSTSRQMGFRCVVDASGVFMPGAAAVRPKRPNPKSAADLAAGLKAGMLWIPSRGKARWLEMQHLSKKQLRRTREAVEEAYDAGGRGLPGGEAGARMLLRAIAQKLGANRDPRDALQIRAYCCFPSSINVPWKDSAGRQHTYRLTIRDTRSYLRLCQKQMQTWSNLLFKISGGKLALYHKTECLRTPLTKMKSRDGKYQVAVSDVAPLVGSRAAGANVMIFWVPKEGRDCPPTGLAGMYTNGRLANGQDMRAIFLYTDRKRLAAADGWTKLTGGLPHEFWHYFHNVLKWDTKFQGLIVDNHNPEHWKMLSAEIAQQGLAAPYGPYGDFYSTIPSWRTCMLLRKRYGWRKWGNGPNVKR